MLSLVWQLLRAPLVAEMAANKAALKLAGLKAVTNADADSALLVQRKKKKKKRMMKKKQTATATIVLQYVNKIPFYRRTPTFI